MTNINTVHCSIKFTHKQDSNVLIFLVYKGPIFEKTGILDVKIHIKPTNKQLYIIHPQKLIPPQERQNSNPKGQNTKVPPYKYKRGHLHDT